MTRLADRGPIAWSRSLSDIRRIGSVETTTFDDLVSVDEFDDGEAWVPFQEVLYRWHRNEEGRPVYHLWMIKRLMRLDRTRKPWTWGGDL